MKTACPAQELRDEFDIDMRVLGILSSDRMLLSETAIDLEHWRERFERCAVMRALLVTVISNGVANVRCFGGICYPQWQ